MGKTEIIILLGLSFLLGLAVGNNFDVLNDGDSDHDYLPASSFKNVLKHPENFPNLSLIEEKQRCDEAGGEFTMNSRYISCWPDFACPIGSIQCVKESKTDNGTTSTYTRETLFEYTLVK